MWHVLCLRHWIIVPRRLVESLLREVDPRGVEHRKSRCLQCRMYVSAGPNFCWRMDRYDKLKPFGFSIHGCVDGFSQRILWLEVQRSNRNPKCVASYFVKHVKAAHGCPVRVYTDPGTENGLVAGIQCYLRADRLDEYAGSKSHKCVQYMYQAPGINVLNVNGHITGNSVQVGGSTSFKTFTNLTFLT